MHKLTWTGATMTLTDEDTRKHGYLVTDGNRQIPHKNPTVVGASTTFVARNINN